MLTSTPDKLKVCVAGVNTVAASLPFPSIVKHCNLIMDQDINSSRGSLIPPLVNFFWKYHPNYNIFYLHIWNIHTNMNLLIFVLIKNNRTVQNVVYIIVMIIISGHFPLFVKSSFFTITAHKWHRT
jgi:hypothetical protein